MPFCPKCHFEYNPDVAVCPDCNEKLVETLPETDETTREYEDWVVLVRLTSHEYAAMIQDALRSNMVPVVVHSEIGHFGVTGQLGPSSYRLIGGGYTVLVPKEFVVQADTEGAAILGEDWVKGRLVDIDEDPDR